MEMNSGLSPFEWITYNILCNSAWRITLNLTDPSIRQHFIFKLP